MEFLPKKATTTNKCCSVPQCSSLAERNRTLSFHTFPKEDETVRCSDVFGNYAATGRRKEWARVLKIKKPLSKCMYVCSRHFTADNFRFPDIPAQKRYLKYDAVPSKNLPQSPARELSQTTTRHLDRRKKRPQETYDPQSLSNDEENELSDWESSHVALGEEQQVAFKVEPPDDWVPPTVVFVKTEVVEDGDVNFQPVTGLDLLAASSYSAAINLGRDVAHSKMAADRLDFRFVDVGQTVLAPSTSIDVDPLELTGASLPEATIKRECLDHPEEYPLVPVPHLTGGLDKQMSSHQGATFAHSGRRLTSHPVNSTTSQVETPLSAPETVNQEVMPLLPLRRRVGRPRTRNIDPQTPSAGQNEEKSQPGNKTKQAASKRFACSFCAAQYHRWSRLVAHLKSHAADVRPFECDVCQARFKNKSNLYTCKHKRMLAKKPFACDVCQKRFTVKYSLKTHILKLHATKKSNACEICGASFNEMTSLKSHMWTHHKKVIGLRYACDTCQASFTQKSILKAHIMSHMK